jgi:hypothetical protein
MADNLQSIVNRAHAATTDLRNIPPDSPDAPLKQAEITSAILALANMAKPYIPEKYQPLVSILVGMLLGGVGTYFMKPPPPPPPPIPIVVPADKSPVVGPGPVSPSPVVTPPSLATTKLILYTTAALDAKKVAADPMLVRFVVTVDAKTYQAGDVYPFGGKNIPLPCAAVLDNTGKVLEVIAFASAPELAVLAQKYAK